MTRRCCVGHAARVLIHPWDAAHGDDEWRTLVSAHMFGLLVAAGRDRDVPVVTPTPYLLDGDSVLFHLARPNPVWAALEENPRAVVVVAADDSYVPAAWKAIGDEDPAMGIPTAYYANVQLVGRVTIADDDATKLALLRRQLAAYEPGSGVSRSVGTPATARRESVPLGCSSRTCARSSSTAATSTRRTGWRSPNGYGSAATPTTRRPNATCSDGPARPVSVSDRPDERSWGQEVSDNVEPRGVLAT